MIRDPTSELAQLQDRFNELLRLDAGFENLVTSLCRRGARAVVFGGWVRDHLATSYLGRRLVPADIDLVVDRLDRDGLRALLPSETLLNDFGGFATHALRTKLDIWCLQDTYTLQVRKLPLDVDLLPSTTVFTVESVIFKPQPLWAQSVIVEDRFFDSMKARRINMQRGEIRFPEFQLGRVMQYAVKLGFELGSDVKDFARPYLSTEAGFRAVTNGLHRFGHRELIAKATELLEATRREVS
jgi:hypothetical protein